MAVATATTMEVAETLVVARMAASALVVAVARTTGMSARALLRWLVVAVVQKVTDRQNRDARTRNQSQCRKKGVGVRNQSPRNQHVDQVVQMGLRLHPKPGTEVMMLKMAAPASAVVARSH